MPAVREGDDALKPSSPAGVDGYGETDYRAIGVMSREPKGALITAAEVLQFLQAHQPLPADPQLTREQLRALDEAVRYLASSPIPHALELLLGVFGEGNGFGVYQRVEEAVAAYPQDEVVSALGRMLSSSHRSVRYWCTQLALGLPSEALVVPLVENLSRSDVDGREITVAVLAAIGSPRATEALACWLPEETDAEIRAAILEVVG